jgi:hypothetical protein
MSDDKTGRRRDRRQVAGDEDCEVRCFAEKHGLTEEQVQQLIDRVGNGRKALETAVDLMKG